MKRIAIALLALTAPALAQDLQMNGRIEKINTVTICPGYQYGVEGTGILVQSDLDLAAIEGETLLLVGAEVNDVTCPQGTIIQVDSTQPPTATLELCGTPRPGCPLRLQVGPPTISFQFLFAAAGNPGFQNLGASGVLTLTGPIVFLGVSDSPLGIFDVPIPGSAPVGLPLNFQGFHLDVGPIQGPGSFSNPISVILQPQGPLCVDPTSCFD